MLVDSHCHLEGPRFQQDRADVLRRAREAGLEALVTIGNGTGPDDADCGLRLIESLSAGASSSRPKRVEDASLHEPPVLFTTIGVHPHEARLVEERHYAQLEAWARDPHVIGWGEVGLDYFYDHSPREVQQRVFIRQMEIARGLKLPIIIHCRPSNNAEDAWTECLSLIREHWSSSGIGGVLHCFTGERQHAHAALEMGFMISIAGNVTFPKAQNIRDVAAQCPADRLLVETDSPYLAPVPNRGKRNEPAFVRDTAKAVAELRGVSFEELALQTTQNFYRFFQLANPMQ